ncbi:hypothetical protein [Desertimonas flava]|uniref:hypothetical protein n=1 Tax=Desertimonas flava TaxID=2064846 RepID=UPI0013C52DA9|nr:hypothetical protein [Desertimonas flava]
MIHGLGLLAVPGVSSALADVARKVGESVGASIGAALAAAGLAVVEPYRQAIAEAHKAEEAAVRAAVLEGAKHE